ncbi:MAG TPA: hypothetical protein DDZ88_25140, partial [Verrucomicrobiales bacterium]|nr:hypothetical protein [Verrucomicrobiales bacterium]
IKASSVTNLKKSHFRLPVRQVGLGRLASIAPLDAKAWLEASPERLRTCDNPFDAVWLVHREWHNKDAKAADVWLKQVRPDTHQK